MRLTFSWKWVLLSLVAFGPVRLLRNHTDLPDALIWAAAVGTVGVLFLIKLTISSNKPFECTHEWAPAPQGRECHKCGRTQRG